METNDEIPIEILKTYRPTGQDLQIKTSNKKLFSNLYKKLWITWRILFIQIIRIRSLRKNISNL